MIKESGHQRDFRNQLISSKEEIVKRFIRKQLPVMLALMFFVVITVFASVVTVKKWKAKVVRGRLNAGQRIVIVVNPTVLTGGNILYDYTVPNDITAVKGNITINGKIIP